MKVIADAGGTSTHWRILDGGIEQLSTTGLNLISSDIDEYFNLIEKDLATISNATEVFFYAAGVGINVSKDKNFINKLKVLFPNAELHLETDLLGAARGLCFKRQGFVGVLGTGASMCYYDGSYIKIDLPSLGFILGDEGGAAYMGKLLLKDFFRGKMPTQISNRLRKRIKETDGELLNSIYKQEEGKKVLSSYSRFILQNINTPYCYNLVSRCFQDYFAVFASADMKKLPIHFNGSIAFYFSDVLRQVGSDLGYSIGTIVENPIAGLALYHQKG